MKQSKMNKKEKSAAKELVPEEFTNEDAESNLDKIFAYLNGPKRKIKRTDKHSSRKGTTSMEKTVSDLSDMFTSNSEKFTPDEHKPVITNPLSSKSSSWDASVEERISLTSIFSLVSNFSLCERVLYESYHAEAKCGEDSLLIYKQSLLGLLNSRLFSIYPSLLAETPKKEGAEKDNCFQQLKTIKYALNLLLAKRSNTGDLEVKFPYDKVYWNYRTKKNRSNVPLNGSGNIQEYQQDIYNDDDFLGQLNVHSKKINFKSAKITRIRFLQHAKADNISPSIENFNCTEIPAMHSFCQEKIKTFSMAQREAVKPSSAVLNALFMS